MFSCHPPALSVYISRYLIFCNQGILGDLEIEHTHTYKIGAILKSILKTFTRMDSPCGQNLKCDPGLLHLFHKFNGPFRFDRPDIIVIVETAAIDIKVHPLVFWRCRPVISEWGTLGPYVREAHRETPPSTLLPHPLHPGAPAPLKSHAPARESPYRRCAAAATDRRQS